MINARALSKERAQSTTEQVVNQYYENLQQVLIKNNLTEKPHLIYNFDEKGIQTEHRLQKFWPGVILFPVLNQLGLQSQLC